VRVILNNKEAAYIVNRIHLLEEKGYKIAVTYYSAKGAKNIEALTNIEISFKVFLPSGVEISDKILFFDI
jgi:hypothetical protein